MKGRALPNAHYSPTRLLHSVKLGADGRHHPINTNTALAEIAEKVADIVDRHGPRSVALLIGQPASAYPAAAHMAVAFMKALGSGMVFTTATIDQPGLIVANALHGEWEAGRIASHEADALLMVGGNPVISKQYLSQNPARKLKDSVNGGAKLIVIDPRATETARRAHVHLAVRPGEDATVLAGLINRLIRKDALDHSFITENVTGFDALKKAVEAFTPDYVARRADIAIEDFLLAADILAQARRAFVGGGTGISMSGHGNLCFYLLLCLQSIRGFWPREGDTFADPRVLRPKTEPKAQPRNPYPATFGDELRVRGLMPSVAGLPAGALCEEILKPGEGQIRALFCLSNPMISMPDTELTAKALRSLDLLVTPNIEMSATSQVSHYVIATKYLLETPGATHFVEGVKPFHHGYGWEVPHAQYTPAVIDPPPGSDLVEEAHMFYRIAQHMGLPISLSTGAGLDFSDDSESDDWLDMENEPTTDQLFDIYCRGSAVPLDRVRAQDGPHIYKEVYQQILQRDATCSARLDVGNTSMIEELHLLVRDTASDAAYPFKLIPRRANQVIGSTLRMTPGINKTTYNPAFMNPSDLDRLGLESGQLLEIRSRHGSVRAIAAEDPDLKAGVLSITHSYGPAPDENDDVSIVGTNVNLLLSLDEDFDPITGMPLMGAVPVSISAS